MLRLMLCVLTVCSACVIFVRACACVFCAFSQFSLLLLQLVVCFCHGHQSVVSPIAIVENVIFFRRDLVANLGGGAGSAARRPQLQ
jgi:hypothetical protein